MTIDGLSPRKVLQPGSVEEVAEAVRSEKGAIVPVGSQTQLHFGNPLRQFDCALDLTKLSRITEYNPADLTIHAEAGVTLGQLKATLLEQRQFLPLDPWNGDAATIGGIVAVNAQGPFRAIGTIRDWIIGMKVVGADGQISKTGGRVVKNVTGYDLAKLYTGSLGSLGIIVEISFKLRAAFVKTATAVSSFRDASAARAIISALRKSQLQPVALEWVGPENAVMVRFGEHPRAVDWQLANLPAGDWRVFESDEERGVWDRLRDRYHRMGPILVRVVGLPASAHEIIDDCRPSAWITHALNGTVLVALDQTEDLIRLRPWYRAVIERAPLETRRDIPTFGLAGPEFQLMKRMKEALDPGGRLNPGRHVDGEVGS